VLPNAHDNPLQGENCWRGQLRSQFSKIKGVIPMSKKIVKMFALLVICGAVLASTSFAETLATVAVTP
jgi:hypothetical protein